MSTYIRIVPGLVKVRIGKKNHRTGKRGVRWYIGPRWLRFGFGAGGRGVSTGAGPFTHYEPLRKKPPRQ